MELKQVGKTLEVRNARIIFRNFSGEASQFNAEGNRDFTLIIPEEHVDELREYGWNIREREPRNEDESPLYTLKVKVSYKHRGPSIYVTSRNSTPIRLTESTVSMLDNIDIQSVDMDITASNWTVGNRSGVSAYLDAMEVVQNIDRFAARYADEGIEVR